MVVDIRYHLASLVAVFMSLGLGILIGTSLADGGRLEDEQERLADQIAVGMQKLREENRELQAAVASKEEQLVAERAVAEAALPFVLRDRLAGRRIVLLQAGEIGEDAGRISRALSTAGARVVDELVVTESAGAATAAAESELREYVARMPAADWAVLIGPGWSDGDGHGVDNGVLHIFEDRGMRVAWVETSRRSGSSRQDLLHVDGAVSSSGLLALVEGLRRDASGFYGSQETLAEILAAIREAGPGGR